MLSSGVLILVAATLYQALEHDGGFVTQPITTQEVPLPIVPQKKTMGIDAHAKLVSNGALMRRTDPAALSAGDPKSETDKADESPYGDDSTGDDSKEETAGDDSEVEDEYAGADGGEDWSHCWPAWSTIAWNTTKCEGKTCGKGYKQKRHRAFMPEMEVAGHNKCKDAGHSIKGDEYQTQPCKGADGQPFPSCTAVNYDDLKAQLHHDWSLHASEAQDTLDILNNLVDQKAALNITYQQHLDRAMTYENSIQEAIDKIERFERKAIRKSEHHTICSQNSNELTAECRPEDTNTMPDAHDAAWTKEEGGEKKRVGQH